MPGLGVCPGYIIAEHKCYEGTYYCTGVLIASCQSVVGPLPYSYLGGCSGYSYSGLPATSCCPGAENWSTEQVGITVYPTYALAFAALTNPCAEC